MTATRPFFILSSGRSGTAAMARLLAGYDSVEMHHEYLCTHVQELAVRHYLGLTGEREAMEALARWHGSAVHYCERPLFGDSSNKLSWLVAPLARLFPEARFIHLVRDGRKVASSFFHKLADECYDDRSTAALQRWYDDPHRHPPPPPEKRYWWNVPRRDDPRAEAFRHYDRFQRICFHWAEVNREIRTRLDALDPARWRRFRLEELTRDPAQLERLLAFLGLPCGAEQIALMARPHNVNRPVDRPLDGSQREKFWAIAGEEMAHYGYDRAPEYTMRYDAPEGERTA